MTSLSEKVRIDSGKIIYREGQRETIQASLHALPDGNYDFEIKPRKPKRSLPQNSRYWSILQGYSIRAGYSPEELHEALKLEILGSKKIVVFGSLKLIGNSTKELTKLEFFEYCQKAELLLAEYFGGD